MKTIYNLTGFQHTRKLWGAESIPKRYVVMGTLLYLSVLSGFAAIGGYLGFALISPVVAAPVAVALFSALTAILAVVLLRSLTFIDWNYVLSGFPKDRQKELRSPIFQATMMFAFLFNNTQAISAGEEIVASEYNLKLASSEEKATSTESEEAPGFELNRLKLQFSRYGGFIAYGATGFFFTLVTLNQISTLINPASSLLSSGGMPLIISVIVAVFIGWAGGHRNFYGSLNTPTATLIINSLKNDVQLDDSDKKKLNPTEPKTIKILRLASTVMLGLVVMLSCVTTMGLLLAWGFVGGSFASLFNYSAGEILTVILQPSALGLGILFLTLSLVTSIMAMKGWYSFNSYYERNQTLLNFLDSNSNAYFKNLVCVQKGIASPEYFENLKSSAVKTKEKFNNGSRAQQISGWIGMGIAALVCVSVGASFGMGIAPLFFAEGSIGYIAIAVACTLTVTMAIMKFYGKTQYDIFHGIPTLFAGKPATVPVHDKNINLDETKGLIADNNSRSDENTDQSSNELSTTEKVKLYSTIVVNGLVNGATSFTGFAVLALATGSAALWGVAVGVALISCIASICTNWTTASTSTDKLPDRHLGSSSLFDRMAGICFRPRAAGRNAKRLESSTLTNENKQEKTG